MSPEEDCPQQLEQLSALGTLLAAERRQAYLAIVEALVALREGFNSEPLTDEVAAAVSELYAGEGGGREAFLRDLKQLTVWGLVTERIERVRLRTASASLSPGSRAQPSPFAAGRSHGDESGSGAQRKSSPLQHMP